MLIRFLRKNIKIIQINFIILFINCEPDTSAKEESNDYNYEQIIEMVSNDDTEQSQIVPPINGESTNKRITNEQDSNQNLIDENKKLIDENEKLNKRYKY